MLRSFFHTGPGSSKRRFFTLAPTFRSVGEGQKADQTSPRVELTGSTRAIESLQDAGAPAAEVVAVADLVPAHLLDGGEIVIFAIKPSLWFVAFSSFRTLAAMIAVILLAALAGDRIPRIDTVMVVQGAVLVAVARLVIGMMQWVSRLYVLTNRRIMRLTGVFHVDIFECPLTRIERTALHGEWYERFTGTGTILFATTPAGAVEVSWNHVDSAAEVHERVRSAIHRAKSPPMR